MALVLGHAPSDMEWITWCCRQVVCRPGASPDRDEPQARGYQLCDFPTRL